MRRFRSLSVRTKLVAIALAGTLVPLSTAIAFVATNDIRSFRGELERSAALMAEVASEYSAAELAFNNPEESRRTLAKLEHLPEFEYAALYDLSGALFAGHRLAALAPAVVIPPRIEARPVAEVAVFEHHLLAFHPVEHRRARFGTLVLRTTTEPLEARVRTYLWAVLAAALGAVALSVGLAAALQRVIAQPLGNLTEAARSIASGGDYSVRAGRVSEDEIGMLAEAFNTMVAEVDRRQHEAQEAVRVRDDFLSVASHELRTPLTALKLRLQMLSAKLGRGGAEIEAEQVRQNIEVTLRHLQRLEKLVAGLLDVTRITAGKLELERTELDLSALAKEVAARFEDEAAKAGSSLRFEAAASVIGCWDAFRLDQVITNLLSNALKYGAGRPVNLRVEATGETARLTVVDRGIGIPSGQLSRIFERFERVAPARRYGGLGLGLYISQQIVAAHGGVIRAESHEGTGATFVVELPRAARSPEACGPGAPEAAEEAPPSGGGR